MAIVVITFVSVLFGLAALRWGADSRDGLNSPEWKRRNHFRISL